MTIAEVAKQYDLTPDTLRYYERVGVIPPVHRAQSGMRDYTPEDCAWVELAKCMRGAGLPIEAIADYTRLSREGDATIPDRRRLLQEQREYLLTQQRTIGDMLARLDYKISRYDQAAVTGHLDWDSPLDGTLDKSGEDSSRED